MRFSIIAFICFGVLSANAQTNTSYARLITETAMKKWPDSFSMKEGQPARWSYDQGVILKGVEGLWKATGDGRYFNYIQHSMDHYVNDDGTIKGYRQDDYNIDNINNGKLILLLYEVTGKEKYRKASQLLRAQLQNHPRTKEGGFWHKKVYPYQMWLDGLYMGQPFYAAYARAFHEDTVYNDVTRQFGLMEKRGLNPANGILYHGYDESREQKWSNAQTGRSPQVWLRALGWYGMALVDALDYFPVNHPGRDSLVHILNRFAKAAVKMQDQASGVWYDLPLLPREKGNYLEASGSSMLVYTLAKGVRLGYLPVSYFAPAQKGYQGLIKQFIRQEDGQYNLHGTVSVSGLGGKPYRDGSVAYYLGEPVIVNDPKGMGAFINAANEMELYPNALRFRGKTIMLDRFFNREFIKAADGSMQPFHYIWEEQDNNGYSLMGFIAAKYGAQTRTLDQAPTVANLSKANVYIIVDPDTDKETAQPNYMDGNSVEQIYQWVSKGGVLLLLGNDAGNAELARFNALLAKFGMKFNEDSRNKVTGSQFEMGALNIPKGNMIFPEGRKVYIKEYSSQTIQSPAKAVFSDQGMVVISYAKIGKGTVLTVGDPWFYNEYIDGRKLPSGFQNYQATEDVVKWLLQQTTKK